MSVKAVLFDAAGTLFRVRGTVGVAYAAVASRHGLDVRPEDIEARFRAAFRRMPPMCFPGVAEVEVLRHERSWWRQVVTAAFSGLACADFDAFFDDLFEHFARPDSWQLFPDVKLALDALRTRGLHLGIVSNFDGRLVRLCDGLGLAAYFRAIVMSGHAGCAKPDPRIFALALARLGVGAADAVHVGDSADEDVAGARAAGLRAILVQRERGGPDQTERVTDLRELLDVL